MSTPQKQHPLRLALVQNKLNAYRDGPNWSEWMQQIDAADVANDLADQGKFQTIDGEILLSDAAFDEWIPQNQDRYSS